MSRARDLARTPMTREQVKALGAPALLSTADGNHRLAMWDGHAAITWQDGTICRDDTIEWLLVGAPVVPLLKIMERTAQGVDEMAVRLFILSGRDLYAESVAHGPHPLPFKRGPNDPQVT